MFENIKRFGNDKRIGFGVLNSQRLRHQFAEHHVQKGNETESDAEADRMQQYFVVGKIMSEQVFQQVGNRRFADPAEAERGQRDAKLDGA